MKIISVLTFFCALAWQVSAQILTQTVRGNVVDLLSQSSLPGATVVLLDTSMFIGSTTDVQGNFRLDNVPIGRQSIKISYIGYKDYIISNIIVNANKEIILTIQLEEKPIEMQEVVISATKASNEVNNDLVTISARGFNMEETNRYAGSFSDPSRMVANFAGVSGANDSRNDIIVRGNSPLGVLFRLDDIDIPNPNHFSTQGATGGAISILNNNLLNQSDFLTGAFPAEFGNKTAAVFDLKMRKGNDEKYEFTSEFGFNGLEFLSEGPINKKNNSSYLVSYRYSTLFIFDWLNIDIGAPALPKYQDLSFKLNFPTQKLGTFSLIGMGGKSKISIIDAERKKSESNLAPEAEEGFDLYAGSDMGVVGLTNKHMFSNNTYGKIILSASSEQFNVDIDSIIYDSSRVNQGKVNTFHDGSYDSKVTVDYILNHKFNSRHFLKSGLKYKQLFFKMDENAGTFIITDSKGQTGLIQSYIHWQWRVSGVLTTNLGAHSQYFIFNNKKTFEPRFGLKWDASEKSKFSLGYGIHNQMQPLNLYMLETPISNEIHLTNKYLDYTRSIHYVAGYSYFIRSNWIFKTEAYFQDLSQLPVEGTVGSSLSVFNSGTDYTGIPSIDSLKSEGLAKTYGVEFTIEKTFSNNNYLVYNTSLFKSEYSGSDGVWRSAAFDGGYIMNFLGGMEFELGKNKKRIMVLDGKATFAGGKRYTPIDSLASIFANTAVYETDKAYSKQFNDYSRIDIKIGFRENYKRATLTWFITMQNIFDKKNILTQVYNRYSQKVENVYQLGRVPIGGFKVEF